MTQTLPIPALDHVVINARDRLDAAADCYRRLGFTLTPRGYHTLGSMNHLAMFGTDYLELLALQPGDAGRPEVLASPEGLNGVVFATEDAATTYASLNQAGVPVEPYQQFSRPVTLPDGAHDATFRTVHLARAAVSAGRLYFCQHLTRDLVWRDEWRRHANGTTGVAAAIIAADDPDDLAALFRQMFGPDAVRTIRDGYRLVAGLSRVDVLTPAGVAGLFGDAAPDGGGRSSYMAGLVLRTRALSVAADVFSASGLTDATRDSVRIVVPAAKAFGATLVFVE